MLESAWPVLTGFFHHVDYSIYSQWYQFIFWLNCMLQKCCFKKQTHIWHLHQNPIYVKCLFDIFCCAWKCLSGGAACLYQGWPASLKVNDITYPRELICLRWDNQKIIISNQLKSFCHTLCQPSETWRDYCLKDKIDSFYADWKVQF